ncbi:SDR family oxidoreductase [Flavobacterium sp.]|uniref:SDR family oxidoreductase n=1 Tax=Flavobacterium sp. TaxID=239 RepID=UPI00260753F2|nr:SDR family oxidoreductase [Flavobacterium sp.]
MSNKILVTGASGNLGKATLNYLATQVAQTDLIGLVRDKEKAKDLQENGIELRVGDYDNYDSLVAAFTGIDKVLLVSAVAFVDRFAQHKNVIDAAKQSGVKHLVFTSVQRSNKLDFVIEGNTQSDIDTENYLKKSGLNYTVLKNGLYAETIPLYLGFAFLQSGAKIALKEGDGKIAFATRNDLAEAAAKVLLTNNYHNSELLLTGGEALTFSEVTKIASVATNKQVSYTPVSKEDYLAQFVANGFPEFLGQFLYRWVQSFEAGVFSEVSPDLEMILGRKPTSVKQYLSTLF